METNSVETTAHANPIEENTKEDQVVVTSSLDRVKGWWGSYQQFVAGAVFGVSAILLGSFLRARRN
jgi:hypothetical protein